ncbi:MAG: hypothetical protein V3U54_12900 [Thermodesulfobacteriota bacterium]
MALHTITHSLFPVTPTSPRDVGIPQRRVVKSRQELNLFFESNLGMHNLLIGVFGNNKTIDKVFFDLDLGRSFLLAKYLYTTWIDYGFCVIPVASGKKGYHLYVRFKKTVIDDEQERKKTLERAALGLINLVLKKLPKEVDTSVIGDIRQMTRIPASSRPPKNVKYCTYLPPDFHKLNESQIKGLLNKPKYYDYENCTLPDFEEFDHIEPEKVFPDRPKKIYRGQISDNFEDEGEVVVPVPVGLLLGQYIRPCILNHIVRWNPRHMVRVAAALELFASFGLEQIVSLFRKIGWFDWDEDITRKHLKSLEGKKPMKNTTLMKYNIHFPGCRHY